MGIEEKCCSECTFWDYEKNRCSEWFRLEVPNDSLHRCVEMERLQNYKIFGEVIWIV